MKKIVAAVIIGALTGTMLCACGSSGSTQPAAEPAAQTTETAADTGNAGADQADTDDADAAAAAAEEGGKNVLVIKAPGYTGLTSLRNDNNADGTYFYEDMTEDGITIITNMSYPNSQRDGQAMDAYAENIVCAQVDNDARISGSEEDSDLSAKLTYPVYKVSWESGENEDTKQAVGVVVLTDNYTYYFGYKCPIDDFEDNASFYNEELQNIEMMSLE